MSSLILLPLGELPTAWLKCFQSSSMCSRLAKIASSSLSNSVFVNSRFTKSPFGKPLEQVGRRDLIGG